MTEPFDTLGLLFSRLAKAIIDIDPGEVCFQNPQFTGKLFLWGFIWFMIGLTPTLLGIYVQVKRKVKKIK